MRRGDISFIVNVPTVSGGAVRDGNMMRRLAVELNIPFVTTIRGARMETSAIRIDQRNHSKKQSIMIQNSSDYFVKVSTELRLRLFFNSVKSND